MAVTLVQKKILDSNSISPGGTVAYGSNVTAGNALIFILASWYSAFAPSITDTQGNVWTAQGTHPGFLNASNGLWLFTAVAGSSGPNTLTVAASGGSNASGALLIEVSGLVTNPFDQMGSVVTSSASPVASGSITPSQNGAYVIGYFSRASVSSSYSTNDNIVLEGQSPSNQSNGWGDLIQTTAAAIAPDLTATVSSSYKTQGIAISFTAASAPVTTVKHIIRGDGRTRNNPGR